MINKLFKIKAELVLYSTNENGRDSFISSGYRPIVSFKGSTNTSGMIILENTRLYPGEKSLVDVYFYNREALGREILERETFIISEGNRPLGEGVVMKVVGYVDWDSQNQKECNY